MQCLTLAGEQPPPSDVVFCVHPDQTPGDNLIDLVVGKPIALRAYVEHTLAAQPGPVAPTDVLRPQVRFTIDVKRSGISLGATYGFPQIVTATALSHDSSTPATNDRDDLDASANAVVHCGACQDQDEMVVTTAILIPAKIHDASAESPKVASFILHGRRPILIDSWSVHASVEEPSGIQEHVGPSVQSLRKQHYLVADSFPSSSVHHRVRGEFRSPSLIPGNPACVKSDYQWKGCEALPNLQEAWHVLQTFCIPATDPLKVDPCAIPDQELLWLAAGTEATTGYALGRGNGDEGVFIVMGGGTISDDGHNGYLPHEVGHNYGRAHISQEESIWPYRPPVYPRTCTAIKPDGGVEVIQETGMWLRDDGVTMPGGSTADFMAGVSYCESPQVNSAAPGRGWWTPYAYHQLDCALSPSDGESNYARAGSSSRWSAVGGCNSETPVSVPAGHVFVVSGRIVSDTTAAIDAVHNLMSLRSTPTRRPGPYCLVLQKPTTAGPVVYGSQCFDVQTSEDGATELLPGTFTIALPYDARATELAITFSGTQIGVRQLAPSSVQVSNVAMSNGVVTWNAVDSDGDPLTFDVFYSADGGLADGLRRFVPLAMRLANPSLGVDVSQLAGGANTVVRVVASDNHGNTSLADGTLGAVAAKAPTAIIRAPASAAVLRCGGGLLLRGEAQDPQELELPGGSFAWTSDRDGPLGVGEVLGVTLSPGSHHITLAVTNLLGLVGESSVDVQVVDVTPPVVTAPGDVSVATCGMTTAAMSIGAASVADSCPGQVSLVAEVVRVNGVEVTSTAVTGCTQFASGTSVVRWKATDQAGNVGVAFQRVVRSVGGSGVCPQCGNGQCEGGAPAPVAVGADKFGGYMAGAPLTGTTIGTPAFFPAPGAPGSELAYASQAVCLRDFDLDGDLDLLVASGVTGQVRIYKRTGPGAADFDVQNPIIVDAASPAGDPRPAACEDLDQDGDVDVVLSFAGSSSGGDQTKTKLFVYRNENAGASFTRTESLSGLATTGIPSGLAGKVLVDLNGDSRPDLVVFAPTSQLGVDQVHLFINQGTTPGQPLVPFVSTARTPIGGTGVLTGYGGTWGAITLADDGDGVPDLWAIGNNKKLFFLKGLGGTSFNVPSTPVATLSSVSFGYHVMATQDVDGDHIQDLLLTPAYSSGDRPLLWYRGTAIGGIVSTSPSGSIAGWGTNVATPPRSGGESAASCPADCSGCP